MPSIASPGQSEPPGEDIFFVSSFDGLHSVNPKTRSHSLSLPLACKESDISPLSCGTPSWIAHTHFRLGRVNREGERERGTGMYITPNRRLKLDQSYFGGFLGYSTGTDSRPPPPLRPHTIFIGRQNSWLFCRVVWADGRSLVDL